MSLRGTLYKRAPAANPPDPPGPCCAASLTVADPKGAKAAITMDIVIGPESCWEATGAWVFDPLPRPQCMYVCLCYDRKRHYKYRTTCVTV